MKCVKCGEEIRGRAAFCGKCGAAVKTLGNNSGLYYIFAGLFGAVALVLLASGMEKSARVLMGSGMKETFFSFNNSFYGCMFNSGCMLFNLFAAMAAMAFCNYYIFLARLERAVMLRKEQRKTVKGFAGIGIVLCLFVFWEIAYIVIGRGVRGIAGLGGVMPETGAAFAMLGLAAFFFRKMALMNRIAAENNVPDKPMPAAVPPVDGVSGIDGTLKSIIKAIFIGSAVIFVIAVANSLINEKAPANFPLQLYILVSIMYVFPIGMLASVITAVAAFFFQRKMIKKYYPELYLLEAEFSPFKYLERRKEVKELYKQDHPVLGPYNRIIRTAMLAFWAFLLLIIPFGIFMNSVGHSLGFWK